MNIFSLVKSKTQLLMLVLITHLFVCCAAQESDKMAFWQVPQFGGNSFNKVPPDLAYFKALEATGATWVRLTFSKWQGAGRDFLIGDADQFNSIDPKDLVTLIQFKC